MKHQNIHLDGKQDKLFKEMLKFSKLPSSLKDDIIKDQQLTKIEKLSLNEVNSSHKNKIKAQNITIVNDNINRALSYNQIESNNSDKVNNQINKKSSCSSSSKNIQQSTNSNKSNRPIYTSDTHYSNSAYLNSPEPYMLPIPIFLEEHEEVENSNNSSNSNKLRSPNKNNVNKHKTKVHDSASTISYSEIVKNKTTPDKSSILKNFLKIRKSS